MDQRTDRNPFDVPTDGYRDQRGARGRWIRHVPGGWKTVVITIAIILVALLVWFIRPTQTVRPNRFGGGVNQATPVGVAKVTTGDIDVTLNALGTVTPLAAV